MANNRFALNGGNMKRILVVAALLVCAACNNGAELKQTTLTKANLVTVQKKINSGKGITKDEAQWYMLGQVNISSTGGQVVGKTVAQVIEAGKSVAAPVQPTAATPVNVVPDQKK